jgi:hypothetical protein
MSKLLKVLEKEFLNREFMYKSKYGGKVTGICKSIQITNSFIFDEKTTTLLEALKEGNIPQTDKKHKSILYSQPDIKVISEYGNLYEFERCYFLMKEDETIW